MSAYGSFYAAGVSFGERQDVLAEVQLITLKPGSQYPEVRLVPEPDNEYDANAIGIEAETADGWKQVGYVPRKSNREFGDLLTAGKIKNARVASIGRSSSSKPLGLKVAFDVDD